MRDYQKLRDLDRRDAEAAARANSSFLHHCAGVPACSDPLGCDLCFNAARLSVQFLRPRYERRFVESLQHDYDVRCPLPHPGAD